MIQKSEAIKSAVRLKMIEKMASSLKIVHGDLWSSIGNDIWSVYDESISRIKR